MRAIWLAVGVLSLSACLADDREAMNPVPEGTWTVDMLPAGLQQRFEYLSMATDENGQARVAYYDQALWRLKLARWNGEKWNLEIADQGGDEDRFAKVGLQVQMRLFKNQTHLVYGFERDRTCWPAQQYSCGCTELRYRTRDLNAIDPGWQTEAIDISGSSWFDFELDADGRPQVVYFDECDQTLYWATRQATGWETRIIKTLDHRLFYPIDLALSPQGSLWLAWIDHREQASVRLMKFASDAWTEESLPLGEDTLEASEVRIQIDSQNRPHLLVFDPSQNRLVYLKTSGSEATAETVAWDVDVHRPVLALDSSDNPHVAYTSYHEDAIHGFHVRLVYADKPGKMWRHGIVSEDAEYPVLAVTGPQQDPLVHVGWNEVGASALRLMVFASEYPQADASH